MGSRHVPVFSALRSTLIQSLVPWISWGEELEALHFVCFPNPAPEPEGASGLHLLFTACPSALQKCSFAPCTILRVSRDVLTRFLKTINQGGSHTQSWVWFVLSVLRWAYLNLCQWTCEQIGLRCGNDVVRQEAGPGEKLVHRESNLEACVPLLSSSSFLGGVK